MINLVDNKINLVIKNSFLLYMFNKVSIFAYIYKKKLEIHHCIHTWLTESERFATTHTILIKTLTLEPFKM